MVDDVLGQSQKRLNECVRADDSNLNSCDTTYFCVIKVLYRIELAVLKDSSRVDAIRIARQHCPVTIGLSVSRYWC